MAMRIGVAITVVVALGLFAVDGSAGLKVGYTIKSLELRDGNNNPAKMPDVGKKVLTVFYTDPDVKDQNEPFRDMLKAANLDKGKYRGMGVVNMKDTWKPNWAIRSVVRKKVEKFKSLILTDPDYTLKNAWGLDDCDEKDVVIVIGTDRKVKYLKMGKMSDGEMKTTLALVKDLISKVK